MKKSFEFKKLLIAGSEVSIYRRLQTSLSYILCLLLVLLVSCEDGKTEDHSQHQQQTTTKEVYTCPMPEDSVFSDKPGKCPKCGMELVKVEQPKDQSENLKYTCPMHPEIVQDKPGTCPICGMELTKKEEKPLSEVDISLESLLKPTNEFVIASLPIITAKRSDEPVEIDAVGYTAYNTSSVGTISARVSGRIEKLYVKYRFQKVNKGQRIMDIYSPELMTAQQNLLFLLKKDSDNTDMIEASKQRLLLLGFTEQQLQQVIQSGNASTTISIYSNYSGHIHEAAGISGMTQTAREENDMKLVSQTTQELNLKEGMYVQKGQGVFSVFDPNKLWVLLNIYPQDQFFVKVGDEVRITPETNPDRDFRATINYIEPFFRKSSKTLSARVNYDNSKLQLPIGSQVKAKIYSGLHSGLWLPKEAVLSLGLDKIVFLKTAEGFRVHKIEIGHAHKTMLQIKTGLASKDSVAANAQYLVDSESFVRLKNEQDK